jgi:hypothetical protein
VSRVGGLALVLAALLPAGCGEPANPDLLLTVAVSPTPALVGAGRVVATLSGPDGAPIPGATVTVSGHPPEGSTHAPVAAPEQAPGSYAADAFPFDAPGDWTLEARATLPDGREVRMEHLIRVVGRPGLP